MPDANWIPLHLAARHLGISQDDMADLAEDTGMTYEISFGDQFRILAEDFARYLEQRAATKPAPPKPKPTPTPNAQRPTPNLPELTVRETAQYLRVSEGHVRHLFDRGYLIGFRRNNRRLFRREEVESYAQYRAERASRPKKPRIRHHLKTEAPVPESDTRHPTADTRIDVKHAAAILNLSVVQVQKMAAAGKLPSTKVPRFDPKALNGRGITRWVLSFNIEDVFRLQDRREHAAWVRATAPANQKRAMIGPTIRTTLEPPPNDRLITRAEAAAILGIAKNRVGHLVAKGRLFGWQEHIGKPGCPLYLSENQVLRYRDNPDRVKRRLANEGRTNPDLWCGLTPQELWRQDIGMDTKLQQAASSNLEKQHGEYLNARQAANLLGITVGSVHGLRMRGRLSGYQTPRKPSQGSGNKWWFYRRDEVMRLMNDETYLRQRDRGKHARQSNMPAGWYERDEG